MRFFAAIWNLYLGLLSLIGHWVLILAGIVMCGYATKRQLEPLHNTHLDVIIFAIGLILIAFTSVRRILWSFTGLTILWSIPVYFVARALSPRGLEFEWELAAVALLPPLFAVLVLEMIPKNPTTTKDLDEAIGRTSED